MADNVSTPQHCPGYTDFKNLNVNVFHYGKVGILNSKLKIGYICLPIAALDENKVLNGDHRAYPIHNQLIYNTKLKLPNSYKGTTINMTSVLKQNRENLKKSQAIKPGPRALPAQVV